MTLELDDNLMAEINARVASGEYATPEELVAEAVRQFTGADDDFAPGELDALVAVGSEQADRGELLDGETVLAELAAMRRKATEKAT